MSAFTPLFHKQPSLSSSSFSVQQYQQNGRKQNILITYSSQAQPQKQTTFSLRQLLYKFTFFLRKFLYPHTIAPTTNFATSAPLPDGTLGCPFLGHAIFAGDEKNGIGKFYKSMSQKLGHPGIFKFLFVGKPMIAVYGGENMKNVLEREFKSAEDGGIATSTFAARAKAGNDIFGTQNLLRVQEKGEHSSMRKLIGQSMSPSAVGKSIPSLVRGTELALESMIADGKEGVVMEKVCTAYTLDVAWRQILGLDLSEEEIPVFHKAVNEWIFGIINPMLMLMPSFLVKRTKSYKARKYLDGLISSKIETLKKNGPDGSTLSAMVFATDNENEGNQKLSQGQIMDNALLLILAGSETSASTLTTAMLFLGMYPEVLKKVQDEQQQLQQKHGKDSPFTRQMLDDEMPYLEAVIRETMRIKPLNQGAPRVSKETIVVDGKQIPQNWSVVCNVLLTHTLDPVAIETDGHENVMDIYKGFKPSRWLSEETKPSQWMAFGYGPRFCLGANLAMAEMKIFLSLVARNMDFSLVNGTTDIKWQKMSIIPKPKDGTLIYASKKGE